MTSNPATVEADASPVRSKHARVAQYLRDQIVTRKLGPRHMLETEAELCERFGVSRGPVRQALGMLEREGLIYRRAGRGSFVADGAHRAKQAVAPERTANLWVLPVGYLNTSQYLLAPLVRGLEEEAAEHGAALVVTSLLRDAEPHPLVRQGSVTGLFACAGEADALTDPSVAHLPKVWLMTRRITHQDGWDAVGPDNDAIGQLAARYLIERGCKHLAFLNPAVSDSSTSHRLPGFVTHAHQNGATVQIVDDATSVQRGPNVRQFDPAMLESMVERLLNLQPRPTGVFIPGDTLAAVLQPLLQRRGVDIGREMLVVSCNNAESALAGLHPRPATIDMNCQEIGRQAARVMARRIAGDTDFPWVNVLVQPTLIESPDVQRL